MQFVRLAPFVRNVAELHVYEHQILVQSVRAHDCKYELRRPNPVSAYNDAIGLQLYRRLKPL